MRRVVVTGMGMVTPVGRDLESTWASLRAGRSGVGPISLFDAESFPHELTAVLSQLQSQNGVAGQPQNPVTQSRQVAWSQQKACLVIKANFASAIAVVSHNGSSRSQRLRQRTGKALAPRKNFCRLRPD